MIKAERAGRGLRLSHFQCGEGIFDIGHDRQPAQVGDNLAKQRESFADKVRCLHRQAGDVAARSRQARDQAHANRIVHQCEDDGHCRRRLLCGERRVAAGDNDIHLEPRQLGGQLRRAIGASLRPAILDRDGAPVGPPEFVQPLHEGRSPRCPGRRRRRSQVTDGGQLLLRARRERPCHGRAVDERYELAPPCMSRKEHCEG